MDAKPRLDAALVQELVAKSHGDLDRVRALIAGPTGAGQRGLGLGRR